MVRLTQCSCKVDDVKLITWSQGAFSPSNTCFGSFSLSLCAWGSPKVESCGNQAFLWQPHESQSVWAPTTWKWLPVKADLVENWICIHHTIMYLNLNLFPTDFITKFLLVWRELRFLIWKQILNHTCKQ